MMDARTTLATVGATLADLRRMQGDEVRLTVAFPIGRPDVRIRVGSGSALHTVVPAREIDSVVTLISDLRETMVAAGAERWTTCVYVLRPDGTYHLGLEFPDSD